MLKLDTPHCPECGEPAMLVTERVLVSSYLDAPDDDGCSEYSSSDSCDVLWDTMELDEAMDGTVGVQCENRHTWRTPTSDTS